MTALGLAVSAMAQEEEPAIERDTVSVSPLYFQGVSPSDEEANQKLWNELMKYKLWGTDSVVFAKPKFSIHETSGYTGTAKSNIVFFTETHSLGGPIVSGKSISVLRGSAANDTLIHGLVRADSLILPEWYSASNTELNAIFCFKHQVFSGSVNGGTDRGQPPNYQEIGKTVITNVGRTTANVNNFINNVRNAGGEVYADWGQDGDGVPGLPNLNLNGPYSKCPSDVPEPNVNLTVPVIDLSNVVWEDSVKLVSTDNGSEIKYISVPPVTEEDMNQSPKKVWFDKFVEDIKIDRQTGKILYILMPSAAKNKQASNGLYGKTGRLTRIFSRDGFNFESAANDAKIRVAYVNDEATWNADTKTWDNVDLEKITVVPDTNYAGNLLFYTTADIYWPAFKGAGDNKDAGASFQGTFMTTGNFTIFDHLSVAGQLIAGKTLWFESEFNGEFHYVPFNSPEIKTDVFVKDVFKERENYWYPMNFYLTDIPNTEVSFDYCFEFFGDRGDDAETKYARYLSTTGTFATREDLAENPTDENDPHYDEMPFCKDGKTKHIVIKKGSRSPEKPSYISVVKDGSIEGDEYMIFRITNLNGAIISGNKFEGGLLVQLQDSDNKPPHFIDPYDVKLSVYENVKNGKAGILKASDDEGDPYNYSIIGGSAADLFEIDGDGNVTMASDTPPFDYEAWMAVVEKKKAEGKDTSLTIEVEVCVVGSSNNTYLCDDHEFTIDIVDVNEKPYFDYTEDEKKEIKIAENATIKDGVAVKWADLDIYNADGKFTNDAVKAIGGDTDVFKVTSSGLVVPQKTLDYEIKNTYTLTLRVYDNTEDKGELVYPDLYEDMEFIVTVTDVDDSVRFDADAYNGTVNENSPAGTEVTMKKPIVATTTQKGVTVTYKLLDESKSFVIDPLTAVITVAEGAVLDYETKNTYKMKVVATDDSGVDGQIVQTDTANVIIKLNDLGHYLKETVFSIAEDAAKGDAIKPSLEATEGGADDGSKYTYYILNGTKEVSSTNEFNLDPETGMFTVVSGLDYETESLYDIKVRVKTEDGGYADTNVTINVIDVNEAPAVTVDTIYVKETQPINESFSTVMSENDDPDIFNADFRNNIYTNIDNNKYFKVDPNGDVILLKKLDYEADSIYTLTVRVSDKGDKSLTSTKDVIVKVVNVYEKSVVEITRVENKDSVYLKPDSVFVNDSIIDVEWTEDGKTRTSTETVEEGCHLVIKTFHDKTKDDPGADTVVVCYSTAAPIVTVTANGDDVTADNIYTVVEKATKNDTAIYVNETKNDIKVTVKDTASNVSESFTIKLNLDTVSVSSKDFKNIKTVAASEVARKKKPASGISSIPENGTTVKNIYTDKVDGIDVTVTYYTDLKGKDIKRSVITSSGKTKDIAVIEVSYTTKVNGKDVTISYFADASTGERVTLNTGLTESESVLSADGEDVTGSYKVYYNYEDKNGNVVEVSYYLDEKGNIAKNSEGNIGYNVAYTYVNKYGNSSKKDVFIVLDQKGPVVKILSPKEDEILTANFAVVKWTVNGEVQDTLKVQGLDNGVQTIVRVFRDKAGNESRDSVHVMVKKAKDIDIDVEKAVTKVDRDSVEKYYSESGPKENQTYGVTFYNYTNGYESEAVVGIKGKSKKGSGDQPYPGLKGHLGPTLKVDARVPVASAVGGLATLDDIMSSDGMVAVEGVDAANGKKMTVEDYVDQHCTAEFKKAMKSKDYSHMNLYWTKLNVKVWVYSNTGVFTDYFSFDYDLDDPDYVNEAGLLKFYFELKPDANGDVRTKEGRLYGTGAYLFKTEVKMNSKLRCDLPPISKEGKKRNSVVKTSDELLKSFGYRRPVNK